MRKKVLVPVLSILVVLGVVMGIKAWHVYQTTEVIEDKAYTLSAFDAAAITRIEIRDDKTSKYKKEQGVWHNEAYPELAYDQQVMQKLTEELGAVVANQTIRNVQDLGQYGMNEYARLVTVYNAADEKQELVIGKHTSDKMSYYVWDPEKEVLGMVQAESIQRLTSAVGTWIQQTVTLPKWEAVKHVVVSTAKESVLDVAKEGDSWRIQQENAKGYEVKAEAVKAYVEEVATLTKQSFAGGLANNEAKYGFDEMTLVITINDAWTLGFGKHQDNRVYFSLGDEGLVYEGDGHIAKKLQQPKVFEWLTGSIPVPPVELLQKIEMTYQGKTVSVVLEETLTEQQQTFVEQVMNLQIHAPLAQANLENMSPREAEMTIKYLKKDGTESVLEMIPYDPSFYLLRQEGYVNFSVAKQPLVDGMKLIEEGIH